MIGKRNTEIKKRSSLEEIMMLLQLVEVEVHLSVGRLKFSWGNLVRGFFKAIVSDVVVKLTV